MAGDSSIFHKACTAPTTAPAWDIYGERADITYTCNRPTPCVLHDQPESEPAATIE